MYVSTTKNIYRSVYLDFSWSCVTDLLCDYDFTYRTSSEQKKDPTSFQSRLIFFLKNYFSASLLGILELFLATKKIWWNGERGSLF